MYKSVLEMLSEVELETDKQKQINLLRTYSTNKQFILFIKFSWHIMLN